MHSAPPVKSSGWIRVSRQAPCPICEKRDWCTVAADGSAACCMRIESEQRLGNGGWLHRLERNLFAGPTRMQPPAPKRYLSSDALGKRWARWAMDTTEAQVAGLAGCLGVKDEALRRMGACWAWPQEAWGFPMFDSEENICGMRLRSDEGDKWALRGSRQGIFVPEMDVQPEALVVEGPTDATAAVSLGFFAVGRPSCNGGMREIAALCRRRGVRRLFVLADNDGPGINGARAFCGQVGVPARLVVLPAKDLREWVRHGATRGAVEACLVAHGWQQEVKSEKSAERSGRVRAPQTMPRRCASGGSEVRYGGTLD